MKGLIRQPQPTDVPVTTEAVLQKIEERWKAAERAVPPPWGVRKKEGGGYRYGDMAHCIGIAEVERAFDHAPEDVRTLIEMYRNKCAVLDELYDRLEELHEKLGDIDTLDAPGGSQ